MTCVTAVVSEVVRKWLKVAIVRIDRTNATFSPLATPEETHPTAIMNGQRALSSAVTSETEDLASPKSMLVLGSK